MLKFTKLFPLFGLLVLAPPAPSPSSPGPLGTSPSSDPAARQPFDGRDVGPQGSEHPQPSTLRLGMTRADVRDAFGAAEGCVSTRTQRVFTMLECSDAEASLIAVRYLYRRKTADNEFELQVFFTPDVRESHLHPVGRVTSITIIADKGSTPIELLNELPELAALCRNGCSAYGECTLRPEVTIVAEHATQEERQAADGAAAGGSRSGPNEVRWFPAASFELEGRCDPLGRSRADRSWLSQKSTQIRITVTGGVLMRMMQPLGALSSGENKR